MNDFLDKIFLDNAVREYLVVAAIIIIVLLARRYIAHYVAGFIFNIIKLKWKSIDKATFKHLVARPLGRFLAILLIIIALDKLAFPRQLNFSVYHISLKEILNIIGTVSIIVTFFLFLIRCVDFIGIMIRESFKGDEHRSRSQIVFFFKDFIKVLLSLVAILMIMKYGFSYDIKGLVTGLSIVGAAVALALKENLENFIASFVIFFDKPFTTGDMVRVNNISGAIEKIGLRSTRIRSDEKTFITVPNKQMADSILDNLSNRSQRRYTLKLDVDTATPYQKLQELVNALNGIVKKAEIENSSVFVTDITSTAIVITTEIFTSPVAMDVFNNIKQSINLQALEILDKLSIEIAGKSTAVNITTQGPEQPPPTKIL